jgi:ribose 5-phosphate isomerase B
MKVAMAGDHRGAEAIKALADLLGNAGHEVVLFLDGCDDRACDYPEPAFKVATTVARGDADRGVLICGTGVGMSIAANKVKGVFAAVVHDELTAQLSRSHNNSNVLCMSADLLGQRLIEKIVTVWLGTEFEGGRHERRIRKIRAIEEGVDPSQVNGD